MTELERYFGVGCPPEQLVNFERAGVILQEHFEDTVVMLGCTDGDGNVFGRSLAAADPGWRTGVLTPGYLPAPLRGARKGAMRAAIPCTPAGCPVEVTALRLLALCRVGVDPDLVYKAGDRGSAMG